MQCSAIKKGGRMQIQNASDMKFLNDHMALKDERDRYRKALEEIASLGPDTYYKAPEIAERALIQ